VVEIVYSALPTKERLFADLKKASEKSRYSGSRLELLKEHLQHGMKELAGRTWRMGSSFN